LAFNKSGSRYSKKIDPVSIFVAYEGIKDEKEYFEALKFSVPKQFEKLISLIPVEKSSTASAPSKVLEDLDNYIKANKVNLNDSNKGFIVIDRDKWDDTTHKRGLQDTIQKCKQKGIVLLCSAPSFDLWLLCHYKDVSSESTEYKAKAKANLKSGSKKTFLKSELSKYKNEGMDILIKKTINAINNSVKLNDYDEVVNVVPDKLFTNVFVILNELLKNNVPIGE